MKYQWWPASWRVTRDIMKMPIVLAAIIVIAGIGLLDEILLGGTENLLVSLISSLVMWIVSYVAICSYLSEGAANGEDILKSFNSHRFRLFVVLGFFVSVLALLVYSFAEAVVSKDTFIGISILTVILILFLYVVSRFGAVFPAIVAGEKEILSVTSVKSSYLRICWDLVVVSVTGFVFLLALGAVLAGVAWMLNVSVFAVKPILTLLSAMLAIWIITAESVIVTNAYRGLYRS